MRLTTTHPRGATFPRRGVGRHPHAIWTPYRRFRLLLRVCLRWWPRGPLTALDLAQARRRRPLKRQPPHMSKWVARLPLPFLINQRELWPIPGGLAPHRPQQPTCSTRPALAPGSVHGPSFLVLEVQEVCEGGLPATRRGYLSSWWSSRAHPLPAWWTSRCLCPLAPRIRRLPSWWASSRLCSLFPCFGQADLKGVS